MNRWLSNLLYIIKPLKDKSGIMYINIYLKSVLGFSGIFGIGFLLIFDIWNDV